MSVIIYLCGDYSHAKLHKFFKSKEWRGKGTLEETGRQGGENSSPGMGFCGVSY